jgi:hypothetical protein
MLTSQLEANPQTTDWPSLFLGIEAAGGGFDTSPAFSPGPHEGSGEAMAQEKTHSNWFARLATEDWLSVAVGLILVALVLAGAIKNIP